MRRALALLALLALAACGGDEEPRQSASDDGSTTLTDVTELADFTRRFDEDRGKPRLVVLMSPT